MERCRNIKIHILIFRGFFFHLQIENTLTVILLECVLYVYIEKHSSNHWPVWAPGSWLTSVGLDAEDTKKPKLSLLNDFGVVFKTSQVCN